MVTFQLHELARKVYIALPIRMRAGTLRGSRWPSQGRPVVFPLSMLPLLEYLPGCRNNTLEWPSGPTHQKGMPSIFRECALPPGRLFGHEMTYLMPLVP